MTATHHETIKDDETVVALIIRADVSPDKTSFIASDDANLQLGFVVYPKGGAVLPHRHLRVERHLDRTEEVVFVRSGRCEVDLYRDDNSLIATRSLGPGDLVALYGGGHGFRMQEDTILFEVKQGPYLGLEEKERFDP